MNATFNLKRFLLLEQYKRNETGRHLLWSAAVVSFICILCILHDELGAVVNIILPRRETGGVVNFQLSDSPHTLWGENFLSAKFNYKNSEWGIDYFNKNSEYHSRLESHETFYLGDRTIDRIKEGIEDESPSLSFINNLNLTYNLTKADKYVFNAIFRNNLSNAPYQNELNKMWAVGSTESIYSYATSIMTIPSWKASSWRTAKERISKAAPFRSETFVKETGQMVVLRVGYTFEFGRKHKAGNKGLNNSDTDSGIINMQR